MTLPKEETVNAAENTLYDCLIVGGGVAGLSAAIHLAWHKRRVRVFDRRTGPLPYTLNKLENVPGLPSITGVELQKRLLKQAKDLGAEVERSSVTGASGKVGDFRLETDKGGVYHGKTLLLATGVARYHPVINGEWRASLPYAAKCNMYYCPDCEAPEMAGKRALVISTGSSVGGVSTAKHVYNFTSDLTLLFTSDNPDKRALKPEHKEWLEARGVPWLEGTIDKIEGKKGCVSAVVLDDGRRLEYDAYFVSSPKVPRSELAKGLGLETTATGHVTPITQRGNTEVEGVWVAGDVRPMTQQVPVAMGTGNIAAVHIDQYLTYVLGASEDVQTTSVPVAK